MVAVVGKKGVGKTTLIYSLTSKQKGYKDSTERNTAAENEYSYLNEETNQHIIFYELDHLSERPSFRNNSYDVCLFLVDEEKDFDQIDQKQYNSRKSAVVRTKMHAYIEKNATKSGAKKKTHVLLKKIKFDMTGELKKREIHHSNFFLIDCFQQNMYDFCELEEFVSNMVSLLCVFIYR